MPFSCCTLQVKEEFHYLEEGYPGKRPPIVLLHGMLGDVTHWQEVMHRLAATGFHVYALQLPLYDLPCPGIQTLSSHINRFLETCVQAPAVLVGNSLGGHLAAYCAYHYPAHVRVLVLSGASGLQEHRLGFSTPRLRDRAFIRERAARTFYDACHVTDELVNKLIATFSDRQRVRKLIRLTRSVQQESLAPLLPHITQPTCLIWGRQDVITPPEVAHRFQLLLPRATCYWLDRCGHAPMLEHPALFARLMQHFLNEQQISENGELRHNY